MYLTKYIFEYKIPSGKTCFVNTLNGKLCYGDNSLSKIIMEIRGGEVNEVSDEVNAKLNDIEALFDSVSDEEKLVEKLFAKAKDDLNQQNLLFGICLTYGCNLRCKYCYENDIHIQDKCMGEDEIDKILKVIGSIREERGINGTRIVLFGGEPFLNKNKNIVRYCLQKISEFILNEEREGRNSKIVAFSNGLELPDFSDLIEEYKKYIDSVMLTLNGPKEIHDMHRVSENGESSFERTVESIDMLLKMGIPVNLRMDADRTNINKLKDMAEFVIKKGWNKVPIFRYYVSPIRWVESPESKTMREHELIKEFIDEDEKSGGLVSKVFSLGALRVLHNVVNLLEEDKNSLSRPLAFYHCEGLRQQQYIFGTDGNIYRCLVSIGHEDKSFGTYDNKVIFDEERMKKWNDRNVLKIPDCKNCNVSLICGGGCAYESEEKNGSVLKRVCSQADLTLKAYLEAKDKGVNIKSYGFYYDSE
ncbi:uncharacterized protein LY28_01730 [Ruminiclostridium sufflavum DSM 19573]|uniref:Radical SAM core domain-containing protein n=1 Tax=Ruminiclostridium sufflavum DSM 19573 TaxID=1121337 RepID=A0A318XKP2_9FIRM|nr:radical SAM protein [Ruminiclostridium sufflavum]PYG88020.1 uncharacterized protein LY28_01730 [Ruminiclostridium sufflavum DSM 19573]